MGRRKTRIIGKRRGTTIRILRSRGMRERGRIYSKIIIGGILKKLYYLTLSYIKF